MSNRKRYGLPNVYPFNEPGFVESQEETARWFRYEGPSQATVRWELQPGAIIELWPGGAIFNEYGTLCGWLNPIMPRGERNNKRDAVTEALLLHKARIASLEEQLDALRRAAGDFVTAYRAASMSDEEGLLMATDPDAMRQLWHRVDEAATDVEQVL